MSKNILLINPWIHDFAAYDFWLKPHGLLYLGGLLRANGHRVGFIDCLDPHCPSMIEKVGKPPRRHRFGHGHFFRQVIEKPSCLNSFPRNFCRYGIDPDIFREQLQSYPHTDIVLITCMMTYWYPGAFEAIKIVRQVFPKVPIVLGGKYVSLCFEHANLHSGADYVIAGRGEKQILDILRNIFDVEPLSIPDENNLDALPYPAFDLIGHLDQVPILTSLGCPYRCSYCSSFIFYKQFIRRHPVKVADEIQHWHDHFEVHDFSFYDDALLVDPEATIIPLLQEVKKRNLACRFHCPNGLHIRQINEKISSLLYDSNFKTIRFGFETSDFQIQKNTGGKVDNQELRQAVVCLKKAGYKSQDIGIYLLCGIPGQKSVDVIRSIDFVLECGAKPILAEYSPIPGTKMWTEALHVSPFDIQNEPLYHNNSILSCRNDDFSYERYLEIKKALKKAGSER